MSKGAATKPRRVSNAGTMAKPGRAAGKPKPAKTKHPAATQTAKKRRIIPPATRPGFRVTSMTKKSVAFVLDAPDGKDVAVAGSFSNWEPLPMTKGTDGQWRITVQLAHGTYQYRFLIDAHWQEDPNNPRRTQDALGFCNSVCDVL